MDQEPSLHPPSLSVPKIVSPSNHDSLDGKVLTISGTADCEVPIRIWDWLSPVAVTTADGGGYWSVTLHDVEPGDHMYCAEAFRDSPARSIRSLVVAVQIASQIRSSSRSSSRNLRGRKLTPRGLTRRLTERRRADSTADAVTQTGPAEEWEPVGDEQVPAPASPSADDPRSSVPSVEAAPSLELSAEAAPQQVDFAHELETVTENLPIEVTASRVVAEPEVVDAPAQALTLPPGLVDLGAADEVLNQAPPLDAPTDPVPVSAALERIWTERVIVEPSPATHPIDN